MKSKIDGYQNISSVVVEYICFDWLFLRMHLKENVEVVFILGFFDKHFYINSLHSDIRLDGLLGIRIVEP